MDIFYETALETPTIILDIPDIQAKEHNTDEELRSLTLEVLSVAYLSTTWARAYTDGSAEEAAQNGGGCSSRSQMADPSGSLCLQGSSQQLQDGVATTPRHWYRRGQHPPTGQSSSSHNL